jgi:hypothetical protein
LTPVRAPILLAAVVLLVVAACASSAVAPTPAPPAAGPVATVPAPTPIPTTKPAPAVTPPATPVDEGNVEGDVFPELTVETLDSDTLRVTLEDPGAKAWQLEVAGSGDTQFDKLRIEVVTSDVEPVITVTELVDSEVVDTADLSGYGQTAAAGGCHPTLGVCFGSDAMRLPHKGNGRLVVKLFVGDATGPLSITGSTATWPGEPFVLGPWTDTETFSWS